MFVLRVALILVVATLSCARYYYYATLYVQQEDRLESFASGQFVQNITSGRARYTFSANLTNVTTCDFNLYPQVSFHLHTGSIINPLNTSDRSCYYAGDHYDPNLACSESSEAHSTLCPALNRTLAQGYNYTCVGNQTAYSYTDPDGRCEVGDISGKLRLLEVPDTRFIQFIRPFFDVVPAYVLNFNASTPNITEGWRSFVVHCGDPNKTRIACGEFRAARVRDPPVRRRAFLI